MTQKIWWGFPFSPQGNLYSATAPYIAESAATGSNGHNVRMAARKYDRDPSTVFASSGAADVVAHNRGSRILVSVSNPTQAGFTYDLATNGVSAGVGNWDAAWNSLFARIKPGGSSAMVYSGAVNSGGVGSFGGITHPDFSLAIQHEVDNPNHQSWGTPTQYKAYVRHLHNLAVAAGARQYFKLNLCVMSFGIPLGRCDQYITGITDIIDELGLDFYSDFNASWAYDGSLTPFATGFAPSLAFVRKYGLPFNCPEFSVAESGNDTNMQAWFDGVATTLNAATDVVCNGIYMWSQASSKWQNSNKTTGQDPATSTAHLGKYNGITDALAATGNNAVLTVAVQGLPSVATGVSAVSASDGKSAAGTWAAPPSGDNVTGWWWYIAAGNTNVLVKQNTVPLPATPRTLTIPNLTPGGQQYSWDVVPINSAGKAGFGIIDQFNTATPGGVNHAPNIASFTAVPQAANPFAVDFNLTASDPDGNTITNTVVVTAPAIGFSETFTMTSGSTTTRTYSSIGAYSATVGVSDGSLTTFATATFPITTSTASTKGQGWGVAGLLPGTDPRGVAATALAIFQAQDPVITALQRGKSPHNLIHGLVASTFDPVKCGGTNVYVAASGQLIWAAMVLEDVAINGVTLITSVPQGGTGSQLGIHGSDGHLLTDSAGNTCSYGLSTAQTGVAVDAWLQTAFTPPTPPPILMLPVPVVGDGSPTSIGPQTIVYVSLFTPSGLGTYPQIRTTSAGAVEAVVNLTAQPRYGLATGQTGIVDPIPFASWSTSSAPVFIGLF